MKKTKAIIFLSILFAAMPVRAQDGVFSAPAMKRCPSADKSCLRALTFMTLALRQGHAAASAATEGEKHEHLMTAAAYGLAGCEVSKGSAFLKSAKAFVDTCSKTRAALGQEPINDQRTVNAQAFLLTTEGE
ncbi:MAG: hypothetical protein WA624_20280 [Methylocella sp.]